MSIKELLSTSINFQTFTFEQTRDIEDPETVKCIEFWKSVMKKNLAPIKCTLVENNRKSAEKIKERNSVPKEKIKEHKKSVEEKKKLSFPGDGADIWSAALKEIRKKKLDQLKVRLSLKFQYIQCLFVSIRGYNKWKYSLIV